MGFLPRAGGIAESAGDTASTSKGTTITCGAANTKGSYTQLVAATARPVGWMTVSFSSPSAASFWCIADIAVGAGGSETIIVPNLSFAAIDPAYWLTSAYTFPVNIPAGSRIAVRGQSSTGSGTFVIALSLTPVSMHVDPSSGIIVAYGQNTGSGKLTSVDPGTTINTKGAWTQLAASTSLPLRWLMLTFVSQSFTNTGATEFFLVDVGVGTAGSEQVIVPNLFVQNMASVPGGSPANICFPVDIPPGAAISVRCQCSVNTASMRVLGVGMHGAS